MAAITKSRQELAASNFKPTIQTAAAINPSRLKTLIGSPSW